MKLINAAYARWNGPIPLDVKEQIYRATHPKRGSRAASLMAWDSVRYWAHKSNAAKRAHDLLELDNCEHWLNCAFNTWLQARREEMAMQEAAE